MPGGPSLAIAIGEVQGAAAALALVDELDPGNYYAFHATRADLLRRLGRDSEAATRTFPGQVTGW